MQAGTKAQTNTQSKQEVHNRAIARGSEKSPTLAELIGIVFTVATGFLLPPTDFSSTGRAGNSTPSASNFLYSAKKGSFVSVDLLPSPVIRSVGASTPEVFTSNQN
jgi:hypothetical protein